MKNRGWGTAGTLIAALLLYEIGKLAGALAARTLLPDSGEGVRSLLMHLAGGGLVYLVWRKELCAGKGRTAGKTGLRLLLLIGRTYEVELFDEKVTAGTLYGMDQRVVIVTMQLENPEAGIYEETLVELLGQPEEQSAAESETGATWVAWKEDNKEIRLYQSYGIVSLEFLLLSDVPESGGAIT